ncbi:Ig-like domain-containing protein [Shewanella surugensis]|uniref:Ig-like domain-containing protein n=1 Tax=Shewanella surugensis TaxID=212020 RepID=A0ABT0LHT6_9GAMM|nr:Ig-like domain-containing protein [Shewanella surugensis]MCL1127273.1 Ig-like domain-containing protein [Shewanella surugensis]
MVTPTSSTLAQGMTQGFTALATYSNNTVVDVTRNTNTSWVSSDMSLATVNADTGMATANSTQFVGNVSMTATFISQGASTENSAITITNFATLSITQAIPVDLVVLSTKSNIAQGQTAQLSAKITYSDNTSISIKNSPKLSWNSDASTIASITNTGLVTANSQQLTGNVLMTASYTDVDQQISASRLLTVSEAVPIELVVSTIKSQVAQGQNTQLTARVTYSDNTTADVTDVDQNAISWISSDN